MTRRPPATIKSPITDVTPRVAIEEFTARCKSVGIDGDKVAHHAKQRIREYHTKQFDNECLACRMEKQWYDSLARGLPDFSIYDGEGYVVEAWLSYVVHGYMALRGGGRINPQNFDRLFGVLRDNVGTVADLGCGIGYSTAILTDLLPDASVYGTNLEHTMQTDIAISLAEEHGFEMKPLPEKADLVLASEYFEHFQTPIEHLNYVLNVCEPKYLLIGNAFGVTAPGHFGQYVVEPGGKPVNNVNTSRAFGKLMRSRGYVNDKVGYWDRPVFWRRLDAPAVPYDGSR